MELHFLLLLEGENANVRTGIRAKWQSPSITAHNAFINELSTDQGFISPTYSLLLVLIAVRTVIASVVKSNIVSTLSR